MAQAGQLAQAGRIGSPRGVRQRFRLASPSDSWQRSTQPCARNQSRGKRAGRAVLGIAMAMTAYAVDVAVVVGGRPAQIQRAEVRKSAPPSPR